MNSYPGHYLAILNLMLGVVGFVWLLVRSTSRWREYPYEVKLLLLVTMAFIFALLETSAEQILNEELISFNTFVIFCVKSFLVWVLWRTRNTLYRTGERSEDSLSAEPNDGDDSNRDIVA